MRTLTYSGFFAGIWLGLLLSNPSPAAAILNTSIDLEEHVISVFSSGQVETPPEGARLFFRYASNKFSTTKEALADCQTKIDASVVALQSTGVTIGGIEKTPARFFMRREATYGSQLHQMSPGGEKEEQGQPPKINCTAVQDLQITLVVHEGKSTTDVFKDLIAIEDTMLTTGLVPIEPSEFGRKGFAFLEQWFGEKNNVEWFVADHATAKSQALAAALGKARTTAEEIAKNLNKTITGLHSVQFIDEKEKLLHVSSALCDLPLKETVETHSNIRYQLGLIANFSFE